MSQAEIQRFAATVQATPAALDAYRDIADPAALAARLRADGYDITDDEIAAGLRRGEELSDEQLDQVSGGGILAAAAIGAAVGAGALFVAGVAGVWGWAVATIVQGAGQGAGPSAAPTPDPRSYRIGWRS